VTLLGLAMTGLGAETIASMKIGEPRTVGPYEITFDSIQPRVGPNYRDVVAKAAIRRGGAMVATVESAKRYFPARQMSTTEAGIATLNFGQIYISVGDESDGAIAARLYWKPLVTLIWIGACIMAFGGALSLADRRLRIGAPARAKAAMAPLPGAAP
jgi:cytochrome c-type biogenesis protein CcmF